MVKKGNESLQILCQNKNIVLSEYINLDYDYKDYILSVIDGEEIIDLARFGTISEGIRAFNKCKYRN